MATASAVTSPIMLGVIIQEYRAHGKITHLLQFVSGFDNIIGIIILGIIMAGVSNFTLFTSTSIKIFIIIIPVILGGIASVLYYILSRELKGEQESFLLLISLLIFTIGIAIYLRQSILFTAFLFGAGLSNLPINIKKLYINIHQINPRLLRIKKGIFKNYFKKKRENIGYLTYVNRTVKNNCIFY